MIQSKTYNDHQGMIEDFVNQENLPEALNQYKEALQLNSDPENYSNLGVILVQQGLLGELFSIYKKRTEPEQILLSVRSVPRRAGVI